MQIDNKIWNYTIEDLLQGYHEEEDGFRCVYCGEFFEKGRIYEKEGRLYDAYGSVKEHTDREHGCIADYLLKQPLALTGLTDVQNQILKLIAEGKSDKEIAAELEVAQSTVRNHKFKLREKEKQAKLFVALMQSLEQKSRKPIMQTDQGIMDETNPGSSMVDERYAITEQEREKTLKTYMDENGGLKQIPAKAKKKIIILREIMKNFSADKVYSEKEVNRVLSRIYEPDYPSIRRALIEYGFMERSADCSQYRVKE